MEVFARIEQLLSEQADQNDELVRLLRSYKDQYSKQLDRRNQLRQQIDFYRTQTDVLEAECVDLRRDLRAHKQVRILG